METKGTLYLVATPIGNMEDITLRALRILKEVDLIAAEDTRNSRKLLTRYEISTSMDSYHDHNKDTKGKQLIDKLLGGSNIAIITDAGLPGVSDPGSDLVSLALEYGVQVVPIPGANAALTALVASGINTDRFLFHGFLPRRKKEREEQLLALSKERQTVIIYEAPHRLRSTLEILVKCWHGGQVVIGRELTKKFEEFVRGTASEVLEHFTNKTPRGEITMILEGNRENDCAQIDGTEEGNEAEIDPVAQVLAQVEQGHKKKEAIKEISKKLGLNKRELYNQMLHYEGKK